MKKKNLANLIMVAVIIAIAAAGILVVGSIQGWFGGNEDAAMLTDIRGIVTLTRDGVAYNLTEATALRQGDELTFAPEATAVIALDASSEIILGGEAEVTIDNESVADFSANLNRGEAMVQSQISVDLNALAFSNTCASLLVAEETKILNVYAGTVLDTKFGQTLVWKGGEAFAQELVIESLTDFQLQQLKKINTFTLCFTEEELTRLEADRKAQLEATIPTEEDGPSPEEMTMRCRIRILCETILDNMDKMDPAKTPYVPEDGVILDVEVPFAPGETVIDVLKRTCEENALHIEYSWTPLYDSYYVEGINQIYEFDCGAESGWMYKVNGWFPNYGCSDYELSDGEEIVWCYSCIGLGADVGGSNFQ